LRDLLFDVTEWLDENRVEYFFHYGTLLGLVREKGIIPWTADLDIAINGRDWNILVSRMDLKQQLWERGFNYFADKEMGRLCFNSQYKGGILTKWPASLEPCPDYYWNCDPYMDIYTVREPWWSRSKVATRNGPCIFPKDWIYPLQRSNFLGKSVVIPNNPPAILSSLYGSDYLSPLKSLHGGETHKCKASENAPPSLVFTLITGAIGLGILLLLLFIRFIRIMIPIHKNETTSHPRDQ